MVASTPGTSQDAMFPGGSQSRLDELQTRIHQVEELVKEMSAFGNASSRHLKSIYEEGLFHGPSALFGELDTPFGEYSGSHLK